jgi:preprotein translocase subunit SecD
MRCIATFTLIVSASAQARLAQGQAPMRVDPYVVVAIRAALAKPGARLEYRVVTAESRASARPRGAIRDSSSRRWLTLSDTVVARLADADSITLRFDQTGGFITFRPTLAAADRMLQATTRHVGQRMAILLNGTLVTAPGIAGPWAGRWGVAAGTDSATGFALQQRLQASLANDKPQGGPRR